MKKKVLLGLLGVFAAAQLVQPERPAGAPGPAVWDRAGALDPKVGALLKRACADCHSSETKWPLYVRISPASWFMVKHVNEGRRQMDFSKLTFISEEKRDEIVAAVVDGAMPLPSYLPLHPEAKITAADKKLLQDWLAGKFDKEE
jgi:hypothetical protein